MHLRKWQADTLDLVKTLQQGTRLIIQAPTGAGKNILLQHIASYFLDAHKRIILMVDRIELVKDLEREAKSFNLSYDIMTIQKAGRNKLAKGYDVYLIDEAHSKYPTVLKSILSEPNSILIGVTATALSSGLGKIYNEIYVPVSFQELVDDGILIPPTFVVHNNLIDTSKLRINSQGEFDIGALKLDRTILGDINQVIDSHLLFGQQCLILAPNQEEAINIRNQLRRHSAIYVSDSKEDFESFKQHNIEIVITVYALSKGFNHPNIHLIIDCRPLRKGIIEFLQGLGRGTRILPGKSTFKYVDMCGNYFRFEHQYNRWRLNKSIRLNKKSRHCSNCDYEYLSSSVPAKCKGGKHLTYIDMNCIGKGCWVDFISENMKVCPACKINLETECLSCKAKVNVCNRVCPKCFSEHFKVRPLKELKGLSITYKSSDINSFKTISPNYSNIREMQEGVLIEMIFKTAYYYALIKNKNISKTAPMYAFILIKSFSLICTQWKGKTSGDVYRYFHNNFVTISTGEFNYYLLEILKMELKKWWRQRKNEKNF